MGGHVSGPRVVNPRGPRPVQAFTVAASVAVVVFAAVVVPKLGSSTDGFRNVVIILFANFQVGAPRAPVHESSTLLSTAIG